jgi:hypothetical protein
MPCPRKDHPTGNPRSTATAQDRKDNSFLLPGCSGQDALRWQVAPFDPQPKARCDVLQLRQLLGLVGRGA